MRSDTGNKNNTNLVLALVLLAFLIIGLVVGIMIVYFNRGSSDSVPEGGYNTEYMPVFDNSAAVLNEEITDKVASDPNYGPEDVKAAYAAVFNDQNASPEDRLEAAYYYATYLKNTFNDIDGAVEVVKSMEPIANNSENLKMNYYVSIRELYRDTDNREMFDYYNQLVVDVMDNDNKEEDK